MKKLLLVIFQILFLLWALAINGAYYHQFKDLILSRFTFLQPYMDVLNVFSFFG